MGAAQSTDTVGVDSDGARYGFNVLRIDPGSPAEEARLSPFFDYIISVHESPNVVAEMARNHVGRPMKMMVYNSRADSVRETTIVPSNSWGGKTLLGASIRFSLYSGAADRFWHVLEVHINSPASKAGLVANKDWIIGSPEMVLHTQDDFYNLMIHNTDQPVRLVVFNIDSNSCREVAVTPSFSWGGEGCLGCDVGGGMLHRIPTASSHPAPSPDPVVSTTFAPQSLS